MIKKILVGVAKFIAVTYLMIFAVVAPTFIIYLISPIFCI